MLRQSLRRHFDPGLLVAVLICLIAVWPFLSRPGLPEGTDAELHVFRLHELSQLIRGGELYPRWAANFYHGYGYPIFNYYAPLTYYLALPLELLPSVDAVLATKVLLIGSIVLGGVGVYGYVRDNWGRRAGYVGAALFAYSPYIQYVDPHVRGAVPEAFSFAVFALALWALDRLRRGAAPLPWMAAVLLTAAVVLTHNLMGFFFYGVLVAWALWQLGIAWREVGRKDAWQVSGRLLAALALGLGTAAFFWLPVILERNAVTLSTLIGAGDNYDFHTHFLSLRELLGFSLSPDWGATQSPFLFNLGVAQWLLGLLGVVMLLVRRVRSRDQLWFFVLALGATLLLMMPLSTRLWETIPFLPYFQFPWRLLGAAAIFLSVLGAAGVEALAALFPPAREARAAVVSTAVAVAAVILAGLPLSQPSPWGDFGEVNTLRMSLIENSGRWLGTTSTADYVPATVDVIPPRKASVVAPLVEGLPPDRVNREAMPDGASVTTEIVRPLLTRYHVHAPKQFRLRLYLFDFPGWRVTIDGEPAETELARPEGFIVVIVPQGEHIVEVAFGSTPPRTAGWLISFGSILLALLVAWRQRGQRVNDSALGLDRPDSIRSDWPIVVTVIGVTLVVLLLEPIGLFHHQSSGRELDVPAVVHFTNFGDQIELLGYSSSTQQAGAGDVIDLALFWKAQRPLDIDYQSFVHILNAEGELVAQSDKLNPGDFPTRRWPLDKYVRDEHRIELPADLPAGAYQVVVGQWVQSEGWRLPIFDEAGRTMGDYEPLFELQVN